MSKKTKSDRSFFGKGYYIALILCSAAIGISGYLYYRNMNKAPETQLNNPTINAVAGNTDDIPVIAPRPSEKETTIPNKDATVPEKQASIKTASPLEGDTVAEYAMDCLSYNETTRDWRVHNGVDIAAEPGSSVKAAADGVVYTIYNDDSMGTTVVIRHDSGYTTKYSCLDQQVSVSTGDSVTLGQKIGTVGTTALLESALGPHVHFCVTCNDEIINPMDFLSMGEKE